MCWEMAAVALPPPFSPFSVFPSSLLSLLAEIRWVLFIALTLRPKGNLAPRGSYAKNRSLDNCLRLSMLFH